MTLVLLYASVNILCANLGIFNFPFRWVILFRSEMEMTWFWQIIRDSCPCDSCTKNRVSIYLSSSRHLILVLRSMVVGCVWLCLSFSLSLFGKYEKHLVLLLLYSFRFYWNPDSSNDFWHCQDFGRIVIGSSGHHPFWWQFSDSFRW